MDLYLNQKKEITKIIEHMFNLLKVRFLGTMFTGPKIYFEVLKDVKPSETLEGMYRYALGLTTGGDIDPDKRRMKKLASITNNYMEAEKLKTVNKVIMGIESTDSIDEASDKIEKELDKTSKYIKKLMVTEARTTQAYAEKEGIERLGATVGDEDPTIVKLGVIDSKTCKICKKLWHESDLRIPKPYKLSQLKGGYCDMKHPEPTIGPTHPNCFDKDTKVLTGRGWLFFRDITPDDVFLSVDPDTETASWVKHKGLVSYRYDGDMTHIKNHRVDLMVTPDHTHVIRKRRGKGSSRYYSLVLSRFDEVNKSDAISATIPKWKGVDSNPVFDGEECDIYVFAEFLGYYLSEGCVIHASKNTSRVEISQKKYPEPMIKSMQAIFNKDSVYFKHNKMIHWIKTDSEFCHFLRGFGKSHEKYVPKIIKDASKEVIRVFLDAFNLGDGSKRLGRGIGIHPEITYHTSSSQLAADIGELILKLGKKPTYSHQKPKPVKHHNGTHTAKRDSITIRENRFPYSRISNCEVKQVPYSDYVYDVELEKWHTLFVKRNGRVALSGNCRHVLTYVPKNFGFDSNGNLKFISFGYDYYEDKRDK